MWRPFLTHMYAALYDKRLSGAPLGSIWRKQIDVSLHWISTFLLHQQGALERIFSVDIHFNILPSVLIGLDASPEGIGAWINDGSQIVEYFSNSITLADKNGIGN